MALKIYLLWALALLFQGTRIEGVRSHFIINTTANPFDGGSLSSCEKPAFDERSICSKFVDYAVPTPVARLWRIIESKINRNLEEDVIYICMPSYLRVLCLHRFPRCQLKAESSSFEVILNEEITYTTTFMQNCSNYVKRISQHKNIFTLDNSCSPISELTKDFEFETCQINQEDRVTPWMMEYLKAVDLTTSQETDFLYNIPECGKKFAFHICNFIGRCTSNGNVEFINNYDDCTTATSCYSHDLQTFAEDAAACDQWPHIDERVVYPDAAISVAREDGGSNISSVQKIVNSEPGHFAALSTLLLGIAISHILL